MLDLTTPLRPVSSRRLPPVLLWVLDSGAAKLVPSFSLSIFPSRPSQREMPPRGLLALPDGNLTQLECIITFTSISRPTGESALVSEGTGEGLNDTPLQADAQIRQQRRCANQTAAAWT